jgi:ferric-dicitrate binding protein FerR (iron transport regulator)
VKPNDDRIADLARRHLEGLLDEAGRAELENLLNGDAAARRAFVREMRLHAALRVHLGGIGRRTDTVTVMRQQRARQPFPAWIGIAAAAAALLALVVGLSRDRGDSASATGPDRVADRIRPEPSLREVRIGRGGDRVAGVPDGPGRVEAVPPPADRGGSAAPRETEPRTDPSKGAAAPAGETTPPPPSEHRVLPRVPPAASPAPARRTGTALARVRKLQGQVFVLDRGVLADARDGLAVAAGQRVRTDQPTSRAVIWYADGAELRLGALTVVELLDPVRDAGARAGGFGKGARLWAGRLVVDAPAQPAGKPLVLLTSHAEVELMGTRLTVSAEGSRTRVEVWEGRVRVARRSDGAAAIVSAGQACGVSSKSPPRAVSLATDGLALWLRLDEVSGHVAVDRTGACRDIRIRGGEWNPRGGRMRGALELNGRSDWLAVRDYAEPGGRELSCAAWVYARARPKAALIVRTGEGVKAGQLRLGLTNGTLGAAVRRADGGVLQLAEGRKTLFPLDRWQHVAVVVDGLAVRLYRNGRQVGRRNFSGKLAADRTLLSVGGSPVAPAAREPARFWHGMIDEVRVYRRALSDEEIRALAGGAW